VAEKQLTAIAAAMNLMAGTAMAVTESADGAKMAEGLNNGRSKMNKRRSK
jgi:hypothetical protein